MLGIRSHATFEVPVYVIQLLSNGDSAIRKPRVRSRLHGPWAFGGNRVEVRAPRGDQGP